MPALAAVSASVFDKGFPVYDNKGPMIIEKNEDMSENIHAMPTICIALEPELHKPSGVEVAQQAW